MTFQCLKPFVPGEQVERGGDGQPTRDLSLRHLSDAGSFGDAPWRHNRRLYRPSGREEEEEGAEDTQDAQYGLQGPT